MVLDPDQDHAVNPAPGQSPAVNPVQDPGRVASQDLRVHGQNPAASLNPEAAASPAQNQSHRLHARDPVLRPDPNLRQGQDPAHHKQNFVIIIYFVIFKFL